MLWTGAGTGGPYYLKACLKAFLASLVFEISVDFVLLHTDVFKSTSTRGRLLCAGRRSPFQCRRRRSL